MTVTPGHPTYGYGCQAREAANYVFTVYDQDATNELAERDDTQYHAVCRSVCSPPSLPPPSPRMPFADILHSGGPYPYSNVLGTQVTWSSAVANADGWPTGQAELLYYPWSASSDGATPAGLGYLFSLYSGGSYATVTTGTMEGMCRAHCTNKGTSWRTADNMAVTNYCQSFVVVDQSTVSGINKISCVFFRGGYPHLQPTSGSGLPAGSSTYVYSLPPFF